MKPLQILFTAALSLVVAGSLAVAQERDFTGEARDAWITGKIETVLTLNTQLNPFRIDTEVQDGVVTLSGEVETEVDKDLAEELAMGIEEVDQVENNLTVRAEGLADRADDDLREEDTGFAQWISDRTTTAVVKSRLLANDSTGGLNISVDTESNIVTLTGTVASEEEKQLAEEVARNSRNVREVRNQLDVEGEV